MLTIYLKEFITTGKFGPIGLGTAIENVIKHLGEPADNAMFDNGHAIIRYAYYEFFYLQENGIIYGIQNDHLATFPNTKTKRVNNKGDICFQDDHFKVDIWFLKKGRYLTFKEVIANLQKEKIDFEIFIDKFQAKVIRFASGVTLDFDDLSGLRFYHRDSNTWTGGEKIIDEDEMILNGMRLFHLP